MFLLILKFSPPPLSEQKLTICMIIYVICHDPHVRTFVLPFGLRPHSAFENTTVSLRSTNTYAPQIIDCKLHKNQHSCSKSRYNCQNEIKLNYKLTQQVVRKCTRWTKCEEIRSAKNLDSPMMSDVSPDCRYRLYYVTRFAFSTLNMINHTGIHGARSKKIKYSKNL